MWMTLADATPSYTSNHTRAVLQSFEKLLLICNVAFTRKAEECEAVASSPVSYTRGQLKQAVLKQWKNTLREFLSIRSSKIGSARQVAFYNFHDKLSQRVNKLAITSTHS